MRVVTIILFAIPPTETYHANRVYPRPTSRFPIARRWCRRGDRTRSRVRDRT
ncbi:hypothetical protein FRUB_03594 [Fimbriiglobus ruber]|uniref:Uncharacterized protein n=1 Tax=Fimbriiglobus ruber TaxID=1908690 RepID=A0A225E5Q1_9BACT|nr:hypothetical protein FRUB_03594 [Fimbriiglobus ruber]